MEHRTARTKHMSLTDIIVYICLGFYFAFTILFWDFSNANAGVVATFLIIGIYSFLRIVLSRETISLDRMLYIFLFIFMFYAPLQQYLRGANLWSVITISDRHYLAANGAILLFIALYEVLRFLYRPRRVEREGTTLSPVFFAPEKFGDFTAFTLLGVNLVFFGILLVTGNVFSNNLDLQISSSNLVIQLINMMRFFPVSCFFVTWLQAKARRKPFPITMLFYAAEILAIYFPFNGNLSRFLLFGVYLTIITLFFANSRHRSLYFLALVVGFVFVFSAFNFFKYHDFTDIGKFVFTQTDFAHIDFDAYQMLIITMNYTDTVGICGGQNLLTALLSFVPRTVWSGKLNPTGQIIFDYHRARFTNVSCPWFAEFYFAFGWVGVALGGALSGWLFKWVDTFKNSRNMFKRSLFCVLIGFSIYILRGALLPTVSYTLALALSLLLACCICRATGGYQTVVPYRRGTASARTTTAK